MQGQSLVSRARHADKEMRGAAKMSEIGAGKTMKKTLIAMVLGLLAGPSLAEEMVAEFQGTGNRTTTEFVVEGPWILDWRINSDYDKMVSFDLDLVDGLTGVLQGNVLRAKALGNGVRMFNNSGRYRFRINASFIRWHLKVIELTEEEAARYTPR